MDKWFLNPFAGSNVPITYESKEEVIDMFTGERQQVIRKEIVGYVYTENLQKLLDEMEKIQGEIKT